VEGSILSRSLFQVDTTNILFICGGAFNDLENIISRRMGVNAMGFGAEIKSKKEKRVGELLAEVQSEDLLKFGLIPEFIGRLPVIATLDELDESTLIRILMEPKRCYYQTVQKTVCAGKCCSEIYGRSAESCCQIINGKKIRSAGIALHS